MRTEGRSRKSEKLVAASLRTRYAFPMLLEHGGQSQKACDVAECQVAIPHGHQLVKGNEFLGGFQRRRRHALQHGFDLPLPRVGTEVVDSRLGNAEQDATRRVQHRSPEPVEGGFLPLRVEQRRRNRQNRHNAYRDQRDVRLRQARLGNGLGGRTELGNVRAGTQFNPEFALVSWILVVLGQFFPYLAGGATDNGVGIGVVVRGPSKYFDPEAAFFERRGIAGQGPLHDVPQQNLAAVAAAKERTIQDPFHLRTGR